MLFALKPRLPASINHPIMTSDHSFFLVRARLLLWVCLPLLILVQPGSAGPLDNNADPIVTGTSPSPLTVAEGARLIFGKIIAQDQDTRDTQIRRELPWALGQPVSTLFRTNDIYDLAGLTGSLKNASNNASMFVTNTILSKQTYTNVVKWTTSSSTAETEALLQALVLEFNSF